MEKKDTLSSCSDSEIQQMQLIQIKSKESCMVSFRKLHSHLKHLSHDNLKGTRIESGFKRAFATLFGQDVETFLGTMILNMDQLEKQLDKEEFQEIGSTASLKYLEDSFYVHQSAALFGMMELKSKEQDTSSRSGNDAHADDAEIKPIYDEEPMAEVQTTAEINVFAIGQQHTEQPKFNNEGQVDQNAEQCHDTCPLPAKLTDNQTTELSYQSLESENIHLKKTVAQFQKDFLRMEAHCVNLELKYQNQALKEGQHGQFLKVTSNEAKVKHDIDVIETINIELEHKVAKLLEENETYERHYKEMEKGFAIAALKNELRKLTGNSVNTKFAKSSILGKPALQPCRNQSVVRQPTAFKSERPSLSKQRSELGIHDHSNELSSSKLVPKVVPPADKTATSRQELELLFHHHITMLSSQAVNKSPTHYPCDSARTFRVILFSIHNDEWKSFQCHHQTALRSYALSWKPCQGDSLNLPDHRIHKDGDGDASFHRSRIPLPQCS
ncbi:hypothetical protein Tco_0016188 [Tanacetum coccineum]